MHYSTASFTGHFFILKMNQLFISSDRCCLLVVLYCIILDAQLFFQPQLYLTENTILDRYHIHDN